MYDPKDGAGADIPVGVHAIAIPVVMKMPSLNGISGQVGVEKPKTD